MLVIFENMKIFQNYKTKLKRSRRECSETEKKTKWWILDRKIVNISWLLPSAGAELAETRDGEGKVLSV